mgnify:CR=1 FL=1
MADSYDVTSAREFAVPATEVWRAWSDPEYVRQWWGPDGFTSPSADLDFRVGGQDLDPALRWVAESTERLPGIAHQEPATVDVVPGAEPMLRIVTAGGATLSSVSWAETGAGTGVWRFTCADFTFTASGGSIGPLRYVVIYDDTPTSPADPLVGYIDYGSSITIPDSGSLTVDVGASGLYESGAA